MSDELLERVESWIRTDPMAAAAEINLMRAGVYVLDGAEIATWRESRRAARHAAAGGMTEREARTAIAKELGAVDMGPGPPTFEHLIEQARRVFRLAAVSGNYLFQVGLAVGAEHDAPYRVIMDLLFARLRGAAL